jgi:hypothetical protein
MSGAWLTRLNSLFTAPPATTLGLVGTRGSARVDFNPDTMFWAMRHLPISEATKHLLICGMIGSGKTIAIQLFLQSIAPRFRAGRSPAEQLILFDAKGDAVPLLAALGLAPDDPQVWILNPIDQRSAVWDIGEAVQTPVMARHLASLIVPTESQSNAPFFTDAARELVYAVVLALNTIAGISWTLRDLLCALDSREHIAAITTREPRAKVLAERILHDERHSSGVLSTLGTKLGRYEQVAALWHTHRQGRRFSLQHFLDHPGVLVLGNDPVLRESFWPINAILLQALTQEILRRPNTFVPRHWFVLDEFRAMQKVECVHDLLNLGRSKGACVLLGIQSFEGLVHIYGDAVANDLLSQCANKMFLRAGGPKTAEWAERFFGKIRKVEPVLSESFSRQGNSRSIQYGLHERALFLGSFFLDLPLPGLGRTYAAVCDVPSLRRIIILRRPFDQVLAWCQPPAPIPPVLLRTDTREQILQPWTPAEEQRFCQATPTASPTAGPAPGPAPDPEPQLPDRQSRRRLGTR